MAFCVDLHTHIQYVNAQIKIVKEETNVYIHEVKKNLLKEN